MSRYTSPLSNQVGKKLVSVEELTINTKTLVFDDGTIIEIQSDTLDVPGHGSLGVLNCANAPGEVENESSHETNR